eukprot:5835888-Prymnesium_polylepis.1
MERGGAGRAAARPAGRRHARRAHTPVELRRLHLQPVEEELRDHAHSRRVETAVDMVALREREPDCGGQPVVGPSLREERVARAAASEQLVEEQPCQGPTRKTNGRADASRVRSHGPWRRDAIVPTRKADRAAVAARGREG